MNDEELLRKLRELFEGTGDKPARPQLRLVKDEEVDDEVD